jgi:hypothetical protein
VVPAWVDQKRSALAQRRHRVFVIGRDRPVPAQRDEARHPEDEVVGELVEEPVGAPK